MDILSQLFFAHLWQGLLLIPIIYLLNRYVAKDDSTLRHGLWFTGLGLLLLLPLLTFIEMPRLSNQWLPQTTDIEYVELGQVDIEYQAVAVTGTFEAATIMESGNSINLMPFALGVLLLLWAAGSLLKLRAVLRDFNQCRALERSTKFRDFPSQLLPKRWPEKIKVSLCNDISVPMMVGFIKPRVLIPTSFVNSIEQQQLNSILFHELAHIERRDQWTALLQQVVSALLWWSPWVLLISNRIRVERELACDDKAVQKTGSANSYATALIKGVTHIVDCREQHLKPDLALGVFHRPNELKERIMRITTKGYSPINAMRKPIVAVTILTLLVGISGISFATPGASNADPGNSGQSDHDSYSRDNDDPIQRAFVESSRRSSPDDLARFLDAGADINGVAKGDGTALMMAVRGGRMDNIEFLISRGADVNIPARGDGTALIIAVRRGDSNLVRYLLDAGADPDIAMPGEGTALIAAVRSGHVDNFETLIASGADVNVSASGDGNPLIAAAHRNNDRFITRLISLGANLDDIVPGDETALISAVRSENMDAVQLLAEAGANLSLGAIAYTRDGDEVCRTPLGEAVRTRNEDITAYLIENGAQDRGC